MYIFVCLENRNAFSKTKFAKICSTEPEHSTGDCNNNIKQFLLTAIGQGNSFLIRLN